MQPAPNPLSADQVARIDQTYVPFPDFASWPQVVPRARIWQKRLAELDAIAMTVDDPTLDRSIEVVVRAAAFDTGAIEGLYPTNRGLTMTVATQAAAWEHELEKQAGDAISLFEAQLATYELVLDVATKRLPVTEAWIRRLHEELTRPQETYTVHTPVGVQQHPLPRGEYKVHPNHVELADGSSRAYVPVGLTRDEMQRFVAEVSSREFDAADPILQASYAHYSFVAIHPFADGNGRVARALASVYLFRSARVPFLLFADQRPVYFDALARADSGEVELFVTVVNNAAVAAVELVTESIRTATAPSADDATDSLKRLVTAQGGLTHTDIDQYGTNLLNEFHRILQEEVARLSLPTGVGVSPSAGHANTASAPDDFRTLVNAPALYAGLTIESAGPAAAQRQAVFRVLVSKDLDEESDVYWIVQETTETGATFSLNDIYPGLSAPAELRLRMLAQRVLGIEMQALLGDAANSMRATGYVE